MRLALVIKIKKVLKKLLSSPPVLALNILTVIPFRAPTLPEKKALPRAVSFFPLIGWLIGLLGFAFAYGLDLFLPEQIVNVFVLLFLIIITGGLHLDGVADTVDGLFGGRSHKERLAIMRKSDLGSFGTLALVIILIFKLTILQVLTGYVRYLAIIAAPILSRWTVVLLAVFFKPARRRGFGKQIIGQVHFSELALATLFLLPLVFGLAFFAPKGLAIFSLPLFSFLGGLYLQRKFTGLTGDHLGFSVEIQEAFCWLMLGLVL